MGRTFHTAASSEDLQSTHGPYEIADVTSNTYYDWMLDRAYMLVPAQAYVGQFLETFKEYPPRQKAASFSLDDVMIKLQEPQNK